MPGRRSISVEPENIAVASPRRSTRIKIIHQDSPLPATTKTTEQELPARRTRRSSSIQEKSLSDLKSDVKKIQDTKKDDDKPKTPARRTRRSISAQEDQKPALKEVSIMLKEIVKVAEKEPQLQSEKHEEQKTPPQILENLGGLPKKRVTRSMSKSPVSLTSSKPPTPTPPVTRSRRLSLNDKQASDSKVPQLDVIAENESEHEKETIENDVLNNNKKQLEITEKETPKNVIEVTEHSDKNEKDTKIIEVTEHSDKNETETNIIEVTEKTDETNIIEVTEKTDETNIIEVTENTDKNETETMDIPEKEVKEDASVKISPRRSPRVKAKESPSKQNDSEVEIIEEEEIKVNVEDIPDKSNEKEKIEVLEKKLNELIDEVEETPEEIQENNKEESVKDADKLNESNISIVANTSIQKETKLLNDEDDGRPQNISLVNDDGRSYSPIVPKPDIHLNDSRKSLNSSTTMESLHVSMKEDEDDKIIDETINAKDMSANLDASKTSIKSTPAKSIIDSGKKSNKSTPIRTTENKENDDMNTSNSSKKKSSTKRASVNQLREQILDDYIASFTAEKKRKRESMEASDSSENNKKRRSSLIRNKVSSCNFSDDEESDGEKRNEFIDDEVSVGSEDTPSIDSNEIIDDGESVGSSNSEQDSNDTYENDSFVVDDDEVEDEEILSGTEDFLGNLRMPKQRKRILKLDSDSESEEEKDQLEKMSMEPYGGMSPTNLSDKQISSVGSDMESIKKRNEDLSKQIEDGTLVPEVEAKRKIEVSDDDDDVMIVEDQSKNENEIMEDVQKDEVETVEKEEVEVLQTKKVEGVLKEFLDIQKEVEHMQKELENIEKEEIENIQKDQVEDLQKNEVEDLQKDGSEDTSKEIIEEDIEKETIEDTSKETIGEADETKSSNTEEKSDISANVTSDTEDKSDTEEAEKFEADETIFIQPEEETENLEADETIFIQPEEEQDKNENDSVNPEDDKKNKETKYKQLLEKYFNVTNKNKARRQTISEEISKTTSKPSKKRKTSLGIEVNVTNEETRNKFMVPEEPQIIEVKMNLKQKTDNLKYEFNNSGIIEVTEQSQNKDVDESLAMLRDFNDSLNDSLDLITSGNQKNKFESPTNNVKSTKKKQNKTPVKSSEESDISTSSSEKKRKKDQQLVTENLSDELNEQSNTEEIVEKIGKKKKRKQKKLRANENTDTTQITEETKSPTEEIDISPTEENDISPTEEIDISPTEEIDISPTEEIDISPKKKRKIRTEENKTDTEEKPKKKKLNKKSVSSSSESENISNSLQSSTDSENTSKKKQKNLPQNMFNFKIQNAKVSPSKSEIDCDEYVPSRHRNIYKNLIKPSSSGFSGSSQFVIKDLVSKVSHGIKKQKSANTKLNKNRITGMTNCANWKETLLAEGIVKNITKTSNLRKH